MKQEQTPHPLYDAEKSWKDAHRIERLVRVKVANIQKNLASAVTETDEVIELIKELFIKIPKTDGTLLGASPLSPSAIMEAVVDQIFRTENKQLNWSRRVKRSREIDFSKKVYLTEVMDGALAWAFKREKEEIAIIS